MNIIKAFLINLGFLFVHVFINNMTANKNLAAFLLMIQVVFNHELTASNVEIL